MPSLFVTPGYTHLGTIVSDGKSSVAAAFTNISTFNTLQLDISGLVPKTALDSVIIQLGTTAATVYSATNYSWMLSTLFDDSTTVVTTVNSSAVGVNIGSCDSTASTSLSAKVTIGNLQNNAQAKTFVGQSFVSSATSFGITQVGGCYRNAGLVTAVRVAAATGSVASGATISLYAVMV